MDRGGVEAHKQEKKKTKKTKNKKQQASIELSWPNNSVNKGFIVWLSWKFFLRDTAGSLRVGKISQRRILFILPVYWAILPFFCLK